ncbi:GGDEF domain-containing protein [Kineosporia sp. J2-2]|uniref:GGDEF domain-containing protein n=1 Tax=Kineosporia corallincola TaxID=2835133 RepID=A0ABS5TB72_9ACTN|nr:GGDEF domain-containing protein [Kineosporia corallincola]MBT0767383.1 GGDEF domain-containing protein [Kineosporia corallincola]
MDWARSGLAARNPRAAALTAFWIFLLSAAAVPLSSLDMPESPAQRAMSFGAPVVLLGLATVLITRRLPVTWLNVLLLVAPILGLAVVVTLNLATQDSSAGAQVMLCLPALFAATHLRPPGALLVAVSCSMGDALVVGVLRPDSRGLLDWFQISLVIGLMTGILVLAGQRQDRLVALLQGQASRDPLTGLVTRRVLDEAMHRAVLPPVPRQGRSCAGAALVLLDLDHFKTINDTHGHPIGDDALVHLAGLLGGDAAPGAVIARLGGDEMAVLLPEFPADEAVRWAQGLLTRVLSHPLPLAGDGTELPLSVSIGVGHAGPGPTPLRDLYAAADASLYEAKRAGRGRVGPPHTAAPGRPGTGAPVPEQPERRLHRG